MKPAGWLKQRLADTPAPLRDGLVKAIADLDADRALSDALLGAACETLEAIHDRLELRETAIDLLVADALLTLACDAAAFSEPDVVAERCREMGPGGELGRLAQRWAGRS